MTRRRVFLNLTASGRIQGDVRLDQLTAPFVALIGIGTGLCWGLCRAVGPFLPPWVRIEDLRCTATNDTRHADVVLAIGLSVMGSFTLDGRRSCWIITPSSHLSVDPPVHATGSRSVHRR